MELIKSRVRRTKLGEVAYLAINALLPFVLLFLVRNFESVYPALLLVLLSKWRIFALRPRFWLVNIKANLVDLMVGASFVGLLYQAKEALALQIVLVVLFGAWLLYLKPKSDGKSMAAQAGIAQFVSLTALFSFSTETHELLILAGAWLIAYGTARHVVSNYDESYVEFISLAWGLLFAQLAWLLYRWTNVYDVHLAVQIPQIALLGLVISFAAGRLYGMAQNGKLEESVIRSTVLFSGVLVAAILVFSRWDVTI